MVDTVLQFEGDRNHVYRILRSLKNRFGSTAEIGIYEMLEAVYVKFPILRRYWFRIKTKNCQTAMHLL
jgi:predicted ATP-dependent serine protease